MVTLDSRLKFGNKLNFVVIKSGKLLGFLMKSTVNFRNTRHTEIILSLLSVIWNHVSDVVVKILEKSTKMFS